MPLLSSSLLVAISELLGAPLWPCWNLQLLVSAGERGTGADIDRLERRQGIVPEQKPERSCEGLLPLQPALTGPLWSHKMRFLDRHMASTQECMEGPSDGYLQSGAWRGPDPAYTDLSNLVIKRYKLSPREEIKNIQADPTYRHTIPACT